MWSCGISECNRPAVRGAGDCIICDTHLCSRHLDKDHHLCASLDSNTLEELTRQAETREIQQLMTALNLVELQSRATALHNGVHCHVESSLPNQGDKYLVMGGMNYHVRIVFDDGVRWIARIRRSNATSPPPSLRNRIIQSEIATLDHLAKTNIRAPRVHGHALEGGDNPVGVGYILMDDMPGKVLDLSRASSQQTTKVINQIADMYLELQKFPFTKIGCLCQSGPQQVDAFARECLTDFKRDMMHPIGPFHSLHDYYKATIDLLLDLIHRQEILTDNALEAYLMYRYLLDKVPEIYPQSPSGVESFYLTHADDKGDHILVDEEYNITAVIDWEWAYVTSAMLAFNSPTMLFPVGDFFAGSKTIGDQEATLANILDQKGAHNLAEIVRNGRLHHQFAFCCTFDLGVSFEDIVVFFGALRDTIEPRCKHDQARWKIPALQQYKDDWRLHDLLSISILYE